MAGAIDTGGSNGELKDVTIVGGGLAGATLALALAKARPDLRVALIESNTYAADGQALPSFDERTTAVSPTSQQVFVELGLWPVMAPFASPIRNIHVSDRGRVGLLHMSPADNDGQMLGFVIKNRGMGTALATALASARIDLRAPATASKVKPMAGGVELTLADGATFFTRLLVIADGADSPLRQQLGIGETVHDYHQVAIVSSVRISRAHQATAYERFTEDGPVALLPLADHQGMACGLVWTCREADAARLQAMSEAEFLARLQSVFGFRLGRFTSLGQRHGYALKLRQACEQVRANLVLMGNAAHFLHPVAGQGFNLALRDNLRLVETLKNTAAADLGRLSGLRRYQQAQARDQATTVFLSHNFDRLFRETRAGVPQMRSLGFLLLNAVPAVRQQFLLAMSGRASAKAQPWS